MGGSTASDNRYLDSTTRTGRVVKRRAAIPPVHLDPGRGGEIPPPASSCHTSYEIVLALNEDRGILPLAPVERVLRASMRRDHIRIRRVEFQFRKLARWEPRKIE